MSSIIHGVVDFTWPMVLISSIIVISLRITYLIRKKEKFVLYKELFILSFIIYVLCLFQVVTSTDAPSWTTNNFIPFKEILRYRIGSKLFIKNVVGNMLLFLPYGFFTSLLLKPKKSYLIIFLTVIASVSIEIVQMKIGRVFDVDDILLNIIGGYLGYLLYALLRKVAEHIPEFFKSDLVLNVIAIFLLICCITLI